MFAVFARSMAHPSIHTDLAEFTRRANTEFWKMMAVEAMICAVACMVIIKRT
jgi:hypothetical protein